MFSGSTEVNAGATHQRVMTYAARSPFGRLPRAKTNFTGSQSEAVDTRVKALVYLYGKETKIDPLQS
jgi:hypothetical protein